MAIDPNVKEPYQSVAYGAYVEITGDSRFPAVTSTHTGFEGTRTVIYPHYALLTKDIDAGTGDSNLSIAAGEVPGTSYIEKFGANLSVNADIETIWEFGGIYEYLTTASAVSAVSDESGDTAPAGTGARTIELQGLDANYNTITEVISTGGTGGGASTTQQFLRIYRAFVKTTGSTGTNEGNILIKSGSTTVITIGTHGTGANKEGFGQSQTSVYTVPEGKTGYITQWSVGSSVYNSGVQAFLQVSEVDNGPLLRTRDVMFLNNYSIKDYKVPLHIPEKSDIEVRAYNNATGIPVSTSYNVILVDNA